MHPENDYAFKDDHAQACCQSNVTSLLDGVRRARRSTTNGVDRKQEPKHPQCPLEQLCTHRSESSQMRLALCAQQLLLERNGVDVVASHRGLTIRAETEEVISATLEVLNDFYRSKMDMADSLSQRRHPGAAMDGFKDQVRG